LRCGGCALQDQEMTTEQRCDAVGTATACLAALADPGVLELWPVQGGEADEAIIPLDIVKKYFWRNFNHRDHRNRFRH